MRIAFFSGDITRGGGTERVTVNVANAMQSQMLHHVFVISLAKSRTTPFFSLDEQIPNLTLTSCQLPGPFSIMLGFPRLIFYLKKYHIDVLIDVDAVLDVISIPVCRMLGVKVVSWEHFNEYHIRHFFYRRWIQKISDRYADAVVVLTRQSQIDNRKFRHIQGIVRMIPNPAPEVDHTFVHTLHDPVKLISVGNIVQRKGFDRIPRIAAILRSKHPDLRWTWSIYGEGLEKKNLQKQIDQMGFHHQIILCDPSSDIGHYMEMSDIFVMTSHWECLPMALLEAKKYGLPSIAFHIKTGPSVLIRHGFDGYLIPRPHQDSYFQMEKMADAIAQLMQDDEKYQSFSANSVTNLETFRMERILEQWNQLFSLLR